MADKYIQVTDVDEAWRLRQAGLLHAGDIGPVYPHMTYSEHCKHFAFPGQYLVLVEDDEE